MNKSTLIEEDVMDLLKELATKESLYAHRANELLYRLSLVDIDQENAWQFAHNTVVRGTTDAAALDLTTPSLEGLGCWPWYENELFVQTAHVEGDSRTWIETSIRDGSSMSRTTDGAL